MKGKRPLIYRTVTDRPLDLSRLTARERRFLSAVRRKYATRPDWTRFSAWWNREFKRAGMKNFSAVYDVCQDLESRLGLEQGFIAELSYRDFLDDLIEDRFGSRNQFCRKTGMDPGHLSRVLDGRADVSLQNLTKLLKALGAMLVVRTIEVVKAETSPEAARKALAKVG